ncbi:GGDEF-domain containing protein, partial [Rhizobium johnstonii]
AVAVYVAFALPDRWLIPDFAHVTIAARFAVATIALLAFEILRLANAKTVWLDITCDAALLVGYVGLLDPAMATRDVTAMSYYMRVGAIVMMGASRCV